MEKKKNIIIGVLVVIVIILLALVLIMYKDKNKVSDNNDTNTNEVNTNKVDNNKNQAEEITELDINSSEVQNLEKIYDLMFDVNSCKFYSPTREYFIEDSYLFKNIPNYAAISILFNYEKPGEKIFEKTFTEDEVSKLKEDYKKIFGESNEIIFEEEFGYCPTFNYKNGVLSTGNTDCGCGSGIRPPEKVEVIIKAEKDSNEIKIFKKVGFLVNKYIEADQNDIFVIAKDVDGNEVLDNLDLDNYENMLDKAQTYLNENKDKFNTYIVTYKKNSDDSYYIYSLEKEK